MALRAADLDILSFLWERLPKPDGVHIHYTRADVDSLWHLGIVDTTTCPLPTWRSAFTPFADPKSGYRLNRADFLSLDRYRYKGEIFAPFDARLINEGQYTDAGFDELVQLSITPSCSLSRTELTERTKNLKHRIRQPNGLFKIDALVKKEIGRWIEQFPSPTRRLELLFAAMINAHASRLASGGKSSGSAAESDAPFSAFSWLPTDLSQTHIKALRTLEQARSPEELHVDPIGTTPLHKIRRSPKGIKG